MTLDSFPRYPLTFGPSPVHRLERLTEHLGGAPCGPSATTCQCGLAFGGNKTRKLEYLVADALAKGCDTLVSIGGVQSNHTRQVAAVAARAGLGCVLVQESWVDWPDAVYDRVGNILLSRHHGRRRAARGGRLRHRLQGELGAGARARSWSAAARPTRSRPAPPTTALGGLGFAGWAREVEAAGARARRLLRHDRRLLGHRLDAGRHDRRLRATSERPRRVLGIDGSAKPRRDARAGRPHRPRAPPR